MNLLEYEGEHHRSEGFLLVALFEIVKRFSGQTKKKGTRTQRTPNVPINHLIDFSSYVSIGTGGFEPPTSSMSRKRSPPELRAFTSQRV